jgi:predicted amino acid dehydrogenase
MEERATGWIMDKIEAAVDVARNAGCHVVGFGGYTSIVTAACLRLRTNGITLTTGNALTVGMGIAALRAAARVQGIDLATSRLAVLGATGNIGSTCAALLAPEVREVVLVVRNRRYSKLAPIVEKIRAIAPNAVLRIADELTVLADCPLIVTASSAPVPIVHPRHLGRGPVAICDISLPSNVSAEVLECANVLVVPGGVVRLPFNDTFAVGGLPLPAGYVFACMAETLLMGLEETWGHPSIGPVTVAGVQHAMAVADKHGFTLGEFHASDGSLAVGPARHQRHDGC